jgi:histidine triad (HIT) family protein
MPPNCLFCQIVAGQVTAKVFYQNEQVMAIPDINPQAPTHILLLPKKHLASLDAASAGDAGLLGALLLAAAQVARQEGLAANGYRLVINTGTYGGQSVAHLHVHLFGGRQMTWPPG